MENEDARERQDDCRDLYAYAQRALEVGEAFGAAPGVPAQLNRADCTVEQARAELAESAERCTQMLAEALDGSGGRVQSFQRDALARPWPVGLEMLCYMICHEAHHRGQVCMLAHQLGFPLAQGYRMWDWERLWKAGG